MFVFIQDDEDVQEEVVQGPDIPVVPDQEAPTTITKPSLPLETCKVAAETKQVQASKQVKTPDEVEDLPEHEAVEPAELVVINNVEVTAQESFEEIEEKIILDQQEKETVEEKDVSENKDTKEQIIKTDDHDQKSSEENNKDEEGDGKITAKEAEVSEEEKEKELFEDNDVSKEDGKEKTESEGAQEQRELSEVIVSAQQIPEKSSPEEPDTGKMQKKNLDKSAHIQYYSRVTLK